MFYDGFALYAQFPDGFDTVVNECLSDAILAESIEHYFGVGSNINFVLVSKWPSLVQVW